jgi:hypothetical protein
VRLGILELLSGKTFWLMKKKADTPCEVPALLVTIALAEMQRITMGKDTNILLTVSLTVNSIL